jgi:sugar phosphate isomerase/epimerase
MSGPSEIGVTTWSFQIPEARFDDILRTIKEDVQLDVIQVGAFGKLELTKAVQDQWLEAIHHFDLKVAATCVAFEGEKYSSIDAAVQTVGFYDRKDFDTRFRHLCNMAELTFALGVHDLTTHLGFIPHDPRDPKYRYMVDVTRKICDALAEKKVALGLEVGGLETAEDLLAFIVKVNRSNLKVNYDPANLVRTNIDDPVESLQVLREHIFMVHLKDAVFPNRPGIFGDMAALGEGDIDLTRFIGKLKEIGYTGPLIIEGEGGFNTIEHVCRARDLLRTLV